VFGGLKRQSVYAGAIEASGPKRVEGARWFLREMEKAKSRKEVERLYALGSDLIYCNPGNVRAERSKHALNDIGKRMSQICEQNGWRPNVPPLAFEV